MKRAIKILILLFLGLSITVSYNQYSFASSVNTKKSRVTYTFKDANGKKFKLYIIGSNEVKAKGSFSAKDTWAMPWAGVNEGDTLYKGNYRIYIQKYGSKSISYTGVEKKNYVYNSTRKMIYWIPSKSKGQPDLLFIAETWSSNSEAADVYYIQSGKLKKVKGGLDYTVRPQITGKNQLQIASYNNAEENKPWTMMVYNFPPNQTSFKRKSIKSYTFESGKSMIKHWRKDWK
ncbi:hypothetical protein [Bacillus sp. FJAT-49736]|uniref:hypothetical protein n=1 Tax=Bacillus sp. FJAT-49736 TaxID=2833582 RepID=UPI001BC9D216|nr:hypothetical protein [Bacillus sp. FJAT-49736]MBS4174302.1 hypothetical protein [Bacillus sp. FJAT-49736]